MSEVRARELGAYLKTLRDRTTPESVDLPRGARRRVNGLRREEVAVLANVGTSWYTWLEQGRDVQPSVDVLDAIADALRLEPAERSHLQMLGGHLEQGRVAVCSSPGPRLRAVLDALTPNPAVVIGPRFNMLAYNAAYRHFVTDLEALPPQDRNVAYLHFTHPAWQRGDDEGTRTAIVAKMREYYADSIDDPGWEPLLTRLQEESEEFRELWARGNVMHDVTRVKTVVSPWVGTLRLNAVAMMMQESPRTRMSVHMPADDMTRRRLDKLDELITSGRVEGRPPVLRAVD